MNRNWKKNILATAVLVTVCGGIYLNWRFTAGEGAKDLVNTLDAQKIMSEDQLVMSDTSELLAETGITNELNIALTVDRSG